MTAKKDPDRINHIMKIANIQRRLTSTDKQNRIEAERDLLQLELEQIRNIIKTAYAAYSEPGLRQDERARRALAILGFTTAGKKSSRINKVDLFFEYVALITGSPDWNDIATWKNPPTPLSSQDAYKKIAKRYETTPDAIRQQINLFTIQQRRRCKEAGLPSNGWKTPPKLSK